VTHLRLRKFNTRDAHPDQKMEIDIVAEIPA
jgi:hypothetical protein